MPMLAILLLAAAGVATEPPFSAFPGFPRQGALPSVVAVEVQEQGYLPQFPECEDPNLICMDPPPTWFRARVLRRLSGVGPDDSFHAATTSHYGATLVEGDEPHIWLMRLESDGELFRMPRYQSAPLHRDGAGRLHLVLHHDWPIVWLPCEVMQLREPVEDALLAAQTARPLHDFQEDDIEAGLPMHEAVDDLAVPRYSLPLDRLAHWLAAHPEAELSCPPDDSGD